MKRFFFFICLAFFAAACAEPPTDKSSVDMPESLKRDNGKGDWRTRWYTETRADVAIDDTTFDYYAPYWPNYYYGYSFSASAGDTVDIRVGANQSAFDAVIGLYGPQNNNGNWGQLIAANDDSPEGGTYDSYIRFEVETTGKYLVLVREYNWYAGDFYVAVSCAGGSCQTPICPLLACPVYDCPFGPETDANGCYTCNCADACPDAAQPPPNVRCAGIVTWAKFGGDNAECCQYPSPCMVPDGMEQFDTLAECQGPAGEGEGCSLYGRACEDDLVCVFQCPDGSNDPNCNLGINPSGTCEQPSVCMDGDSRLADDGCNTCTCSNGQWACTEIACVPECQTDADCIETGCSGQICANQSMVSTCEFRPEYACYNEPTTNCGCNNGQCGWAQTSELATCLANAGN